MQLSIGASGLLRSKPLLLHHEQNGADRVRRLDGHVRRLAGLGGSPGDVCGKPLVTFWAGASVIGVAAAIYSSSSSRNASVPSLALSLASARASI